MCIKITKMVNSDHFNQNMRYEKSRSESKDSLSCYKGQQNSRSCNNSTMKMKVKFNQTFSKLLSRNFLNQIAPQKLKSDEIHESINISNKNQRKAHTDAKRNKTCINSKKHDNIDNKEICITGSHLNENCKPFRVTSLYQRSNTNEIQSRGRVIFGSNFSNKSKVENQYKGRNNIIEEKIPFIHRLQSPD